MSDAVLSPGLELPATAPGAQLAAARESRGLSIADVAAQLKLSPWQVQALESDDYQRLPGAVFVRGFIRNYARLLKLDPAVLLPTIEREVPQPAPASVEKAPPAEIPFPTKRTFNWHKYAIAAIAVLVPLVIFEFYLDDAPEVAVKSGQVELPPPQVVAETAPAVVQNAVTQPSSAVVPGSVPPPAPSREGLTIEVPGREVAARETLPREAPARDALPKEAPQQKTESRSREAAAANDIKPARGEQVVRMRFARESWVEIRDRNGRKIFSQLNSPGTEQVVSGLPPLSLIVGNANGVQLTHNEQPVNLGPHTKIDVARLTLE